MIPSMMKRTDQNQGSCLINCCLLNYVENIDVYVLANITSVYAQRNFQVLLFVLLQIITAYTQQHIHVVFAVLFSYGSIQTINSSNKDKTTTHNKNKLNIHQTTYTHDLGEKL
jgi:hypothetical protein